MKKGFNLFSTPVRLSTSDGASSQNTQIGKIWNIEGDFSSSTPFCIKNITDKNVKLNVRLVGMEGFIDTIFYPGWNVELVCEIKGVPVGAIQGGKL